MTRQEITQFAKDFLAEYKGDTAAESPFAWGPIVTQAGNDVAYRTQCYYNAETRAVATGTSDYPLGTIFGVRRITCADGTGNTPLILPMSIEDLNTWGVVQGFVSATTGLYTSGIPTNWIRLAENMVRLLPVPNFSVANGLVIEGLAYPGKRWPQDNSDCPLPEHYHLAVAYRAAVIRASQFPDDDNKARTTAMASVYDGEIAAAREMAGQTQQVHAQMDVSPPATGGI